MSVVDEIGRAVIGKLVAAAIEWFEHQLARDKAKDVEARVREVVKAAVAWALAADVDAEDVLERARARAHDRLDALGIPGSTVVLALVDHALDVVLGEFAELHIARGLAELPAAFEKVVAAFEAPRDGSLGVLGGRDVDGEPFIQFEQVTPEEMARLKAEEKGT